MVQIPESLKGRELHPKLGIPMMLYHSDIIRDTQGYLVEVYNAMIQLYDRLEKEYPLR